MSGTPVEPTLASPNPVPHIAPPAVEGDTLERLFQALFYRLAVIYSRAIPKEVRRLGETAILVMAMTCLSLLIYLHIVFNQQPISCLSHLHETWPRHGVLRLELFLQTPPDNYDIRRSYAREYQYDHLPPHPNVSKALPSNLSVNTSAENVFGQNRTALIVQSTESNEQESLITSWLNSLFDVDWFHELLLDEQPILEYSLEYGFLRLSPATRQRLNISILLVKLDLSNNTCFGSGLSRFLLDQFIGYQEVLMSSVKQLAEKEAHKGYVRNVLTNDHFRFVSAAQNRRWWTYLVALCVMVIFTVSISMLLRYSHFQIFLFIIDLLRMLEHNASVVFPAAPLLTVILALIGMEAIMSEFFNDASTAFYIILIVWIADQYDSICCHTPISKRHWVRFFYLYHFVFYAYHARYNGQYSGLALTTSCCFIVHSMFYFFHHVELPVIEAQLLHIFVDQNLVPRASIGTQTLPDDAAASDTSL